MPVTARALALLVPLVVPLLAASCGPGRNEFAPFCPVPDIPRQIGELTRYRGGSGQPADLIVRARIFDVSGDCKPGKAKNQVLATAAVALEVSRGPAMDGRLYTLPVFLAVTDAQAIYDEAEIPLIVEFPPGVEGIKVRTPPRDIDLPVSVRRTAATYALIAGFRLTPEEIAAVRRRTTK